MNSQHTVSSERAACNAVITGIAGWAPDCPNLSALLALASDSDAEQAKAPANKKTSPSIPFVDSRMKRATSLMTRMAVHCAHAALTNAKVPLDAAHLVFGSEHGEIQIAVLQMEMMQEDGGRVSPARFKNSVHNTAAGLFSIAAQNTCPATAIAAGRDTFCLSLLEGLALIAAGEAEHAVVTIADESLPSPIDSWSAHGPLGMGFVLSREDSVPSGAQCSRALSLPLRRESHVPVLAVPERFEAHAAAPAFRLARAVLSGAPGPIALSDRWQVS